MTFLKQYLLTAADGKRPALEAALRDLAAKVAALDGCEGIDILQDREDPARFLFTERWSSQGAQEEGGRHLGRQAFAPVMDAVGEAPVSRSYDRL